MAHGLLQRIRVKISRNGFVSLLASAYFIAVNGNMSWLYQVWNALGMCMIKREELGWRMKGCWMNMDWIKKWMSCAYYSMLNFWDTDRVKMKVQNKYIKEVRLGWIEGLLR